MLRCCRCLLHCLNRPPRFIFPENCSQHTYLSPPFTVFALSSSFCAITLDLSFFLLCAGSTSFHFLGRRSTTAMLSAIMPEAKTRKRNATNTNGRPLKKRNGVTAGIARPADADLIPGYGRDDSQVRNAQSSPPPHNCVQQQMPPTPNPSSQ